MLRCGTRKSLAVNHCISRAESVPLQELPPNTSCGNQRGLDYVKLFMALSARCGKIRTKKPPRKSKQPTCIGLPVGMQRHHICTPRSLPTTAEQESGPCIADTISRKWNMLVMAGHTLQNCSYLQCRPVRLNTLCIDGIESNSGTSEDPIQIAKMHVSSAGKGLSIVN